MKKVGCRPPYWTQQNDAPDCTTADQLETLGKEYIPAGSAGGIASLLTIVSERDRLARIDLLEKGIEKAY
jgi:hypothetical protein